jgi:hypothetical protein
MVDNVGCKIASFFILIFLESSVTLSVIGTVTEMKINQGGIISASLRDDCWTLQYLINTTSLPTATLTAGWQYWKYLQ